jgi:hypothetical protein
MENVIKQQGEDLAKTLIEKSWESSEFKNQLITNPTKTIGTFLGKELDGIKTGSKELVVVDQTDESKLYLNIPAKPNSDFELSENELEQVAGGSDSPFKDWGEQFGHWVKDKLGL